MILEILNDDCIFHISTFLNKNKCEFCNFRIAFNYFQQNNPCSLKKYKDLIYCNIHTDNNHLENTIDILITTKKKQTKKPISTIHFKSKESLNLAKKYLYEFGTITHFCCGGHGATFLYKDSDKLNFRYIKQFKI